MKLPSSEMIPQLFDEASSSTHFSDKMDIMEKMLISEVDGKNSISDIAELCGLDSDLACRILAKLATSGVVEISGYVIEQSQTNVFKEEVSNRKSGAFSTLEKIIRDVEELFKELKNLNYYELLKVDFDAERKDIRTSYFALSKRIHPDRSFGINNEQIIEKMEVVFREITVAYDVLSNKTKRLQYDETIADQIEFLKMKKQLNQAADDKKQQNNKNINNKNAATSVTETKRREPRHNLHNVSKVKLPTSKSNSKPKEKKYTSVPSSIKKQSVTKQSITPQSFQQKQIVDNDKKSNSNSTVTKNSFDNDKKRAKWKDARMKKALGYSAMPPGSSESVRSATVQSPNIPFAKIENMIEQSQIAIERGEYSEAMRVLKNVLARNDNHFKAKQLLERAQTGENQLISKGFIRKGRIFQRSGNFLEAKNYFYKALKSDKQSTEARHQLASLFLEQRVELTLALELSKEIIGLGGQKARYFDTLGDILLLEKKGRMAKEAYEKALKLEPENIVYIRKLKAIVK